MSELQPFSQIGTERLKKNSSVKLIISITISLVLIISMFFGYSAWIKSSNLNASIESINKSIRDDDLELARKTVDIALLDSPNEEKLKNLLEQVEELENSAEEFMKGTSFLEQQKYELALIALLNVSKEDTIRYGRAKEKILVAQGAYTLQILDEAKKLRGKNRFSEAVMLIRTASAVIPVTSDLLVLRNQLVSLALEEEERAKQARIAKNLSALKSLRVETDKFNGIKFYTDRSTPYYANYSTFHLYIGKSKDGDPYLRFKVRYSDDDWLFVESASINVDGDVRDLDVGSDWDRDNGSGDIWEWVDVNATPSHLSLIEDVIKSKSAVIRFFGSQYRDDRTITSSQKRALRNVLNAYEALKLE
jgi:hypothetical protein